MAFGVHVHEVAFAPTLLAWLVFVGGHLLLVAWDWLGVHALGMRPFGMDCLDQRTWPLYLFLALATIRDSRGFSGLWGTSLRMFFVGGQILMALVGALFYFAALSELGPYAGCVCHIGDL